jgi:hypothetical protein
MDKRIFYDETLPYEERKLDLIKHFENKSINLSASKISRFYSGGPKALLDYILLKKKTKAMQLGTLFEIALLEPDQWAEKAIKALFSERPNQTNNSKGIPYGMTQGDNKAWLADLQEKALAKESEGYFFVTEETYLIISELVIKVKKHPLLKANLEHVVITQSKLDFEYLGWRWLGYIDCLGQLILDVKYKSSEASVHDVNRSFFSMHYYFPAWIYQYGIRIRENRSLPTVYMTIDKTGSVFPMELDQDVLLFGEAQTKKAVNNLERCISESAWDLGPEFFATSRNSKTIPLLLPSYFQNEI